MVRGASPRRRLPALARQVCAGGEDPRRQESSELRRAVKDGDEIRVRVAGVTREDGVKADLFKDDTTTVSCGRRLGLLMPALEDVCRGMRMHETRELVVGPLDPSHPAAGGRDEALVVTVPSGGVEIKAGQTVKIGYHGEPRLATIVGVDAEKGTATCDMNDPLAGKTLVLAVTLQEFDVDAAAGRAETLFPVPMHVPNKTFFLQELSTYDGRRTSKIYISVRGYVYDVSSSAEFYGPGGAYGHMAGNDATVALANFSLSSELLNQPWSSLDEGQESTLAGYIRTFQSKYSCMGTLRDALPPAKVDQQFPSE